MNDTTRFLLVLAGIALWIYLAARWQRRQIDAWENRRRIGFQPNPATATVA